MRIRVSGLVAMTLAVTLGFVARLARRLQQRRPRPQPRRPAPRRQTLQPEDAAHAVGRSRSAGHVGLPDDHAARARARVRHTRVLHRGREEGPRGPRRPAHGRPARRDSTGAQSRPVLDRSRALRLRRLSHVAHRRPARWPHPRADRRGQGAPGACAQPQQCGATRRGSTAAIRSAASPTGCRAPACRRSTTTTSRSCRRRARAVIVHEMIHEARVVPLDGRPQLNEQRPGMDRRLARPLGRRHARRRDDEFQRQEQLPRVDDRSAPHRALHARRRRPARASADGQRPDDVGEAVDGAAADAADRGRVDRVRVSRGQPEHVQPPRGRPRRREGGRRQGKAPGGADPADDKQER